MMKASKKITSLDQFVDQEYGVKGTAKRDKFEAEYEAFKEDVVIQLATQEKEIDSVRG